MVLGPFTSKVTRTFMFDLNGIKLIDLSGRDQLDDDIEMAMDFILDKPKVSDQRSVTGVNLKIAWELDLDTDDHGINNVTAKGLRVWGDFTVEDLPEGADPNNLDIDLIDYIVPFDTEKNGFEINADNNSLTSHKRYLERGIKCNSVEIDWKKKTVQIGFDDYEPTYH